jgi:hypothetical protein
MLMLQSVLYQPTILQSFQTAFQLDETPTGNDELRLWIRGFVQKYGTTTSLALLDGVGVLEEKPTSMLA